MVSWVIMIPRWAMSSSTSRKLSEKRKYSHTVTDNFRWETEAFAVEPVRAGYIDLIATVHRLSIRIIADEPP